MTEKSRLMKAWEWHESRLPIGAWLDHTLGSKYPVPKNLNYWWNFGSLAMFMLVTMIITGVFLAMNYTAHVTMAFDSVEHIMRDVNYGWVIRYMHANGASFFFIIVYIHIFRGLYYGSYKPPREVLWWMGIIIYLLMMATAFMGYVLPWGQMSYWGATVITNFFTAIPGIGDAITTLLWGGFGVDNPTLNRFYSLHYLLPFVIVGVVVLHIWALHVPGANNPLGIDAAPADKIPFFPYYVAKDVFGLGVFLMVYFAIVFWAPNIMGDPVNYEKANPLVTPQHIVPEWYYLPFYAILRAVPNKLLGIVLMFGSILILFVLPWLDRHPVRSASFRPIFRIFFWIFVANIFVLGWVGAQVPEGLPVILGLVGTTWYFIHFLVILPLLSWIETPKPLPASISQPVLLPAMKPAE
jgi:quinol-cytochrome oxidoreductase complex cytochrome b subunit